MLLEDNLSQHFRILPTQEKALKKLGLTTIRDLLYHFPSRYASTSEAVTVASLKKGDRAVIFGQISGLKTSKAFRKRIPMAEGFVTDDTGRIKIIWFHQAYLAKMIQENSLVRVEGRVSERNGTPYFSNPKIEVVGELPSGVGNSLFKNKEVHPLYPIYPESRGITSNWFYHKVQQVLKSGLLDEVIDPIPEEILKTYKLPNLKTSLVWIHSPRTEDNARSARKRFSFEEIFFIQLERQRAKKFFQEQKAFTILKTREDIEPLIGRFPFTPTRAQEKTIGEMLKDLASGRPMSRLLEGDVGSGKTAVAAAVTYAVVTSKPFDSAQGRLQTYGNLQTAYMAPTEILAQQHFESFIKYFSWTSNVQVGLITGNTCRKFPSKVNPSGWTDISRSQLLKWVTNGEIAVVVGTHALIQKSVKFKHLALAIIDEQHRFGVSQRRALARGTNAEQTPKNAEKDSPDEKLLYKNLSYSIRGILFEIKKNLGLGHKEQIYQKAFEEELVSRKIKFSREKQIPITYNKKKIGVYQPDFVIDEKIIIEFKALPFVGAREAKQLWTYLKGSNYKLAFLVNFGNELEIKRVVYEKARSSASSPRGSASIPHLLSMTATPIPRTLALTLYGDLNLSLLDEMPAGRKTIKTSAINPSERADAYEKVRRELKSGRQVYVICPRIDEPDPEKESAVQAKSVKAEAKRLKAEVFPEYRIEIMHSKMKNADKEQVMLDFNDHKFDILVSTSVVEVGVNVENASVIIIEGAERFGLSQLHQLRGRVLRGTHQPYCFVFTETKSKKTEDRLEALLNAKNGFELAEFDLEQRGAGLLSGTKQWGISDLGMEAIKNIKMVEAARTEAVKLVEKDPEFKKHPEIQKRLDSSHSKDIHFE